MSKVKKKLKNYQYEYFLKELETLSNYRAQFSNSRLLILGGSITLLIAIAQLTEHDKYGQVIIAHIMIAGIMVTVVKMIASYSAAIYIFFDYIKALEKKFGLAGFSNAWEMYLSNNKLDNNQFNATNSCFIACTVMIILSCIYTLSTIGSLTIHNSYKITNIFCYYIIALYALVFLLYYTWLFFQILNTLRPTKIYEKIKKIRKEYFLSIKFAKSDNEHKIIDDFKLEFESTCKCAVLIVSFLDAENKCTIVGFNEKGLFKIPLTNDPNKLSVDNDLFVELKNKTLNIKNISKLVTSKLNRTISDNSKCFPPY